MCRIVPSRPSFQVACRSLALVAVLMALKPPARAVAKNWTGGVRVGTAQEGPQGTVRSGFEGGVVLDRTSGGAFDLGLGLGLVVDSEQGNHPSTTIVNFEGHARTSTARRPVYLELGLGWYWLDQFGSVNGPGGFLGAGYEWRTSSELRVGLGATYHMIAAEISATSGNMEDYFALGATLRW